MILVPYSFKGVTFGSAGSGFIVEEVDISSGVADLRIRPVAGGRLFDFNYGEQARIIPSPFTISIFLSGSSSANMQALYESLSDPTTGIVGHVDTLTAKDLSNSSRTCEAGIETIQKVLNADDNVANSYVLEGITIYVIPVDNWVKL